MIRPCNTCFSHSTHSLRNFRFFSPDRNGQHGFGSGRLLLSGLLLLLASLPGRLSGQSLSILDINTADFPEVSGSVIALDANGAPIGGLDAGSLSVSENGIPRNIINVTCPPSGGPTPVSVALVVDRSGSMLAPLPNGSTPLDLIVDGASAFLETLLFTPPTAVAITAFNERPFLVSDFRTSAPPLLSALNGLVPEGGTEFNPAFVDPLLGGISLLNTRPATVRRILIFITDGAPNTPPDVNTIVTGARNANVEVYAVTIGSPMTSRLAAIATQTGGKTWENVRTNEELSAILRSIALISRGTEPCRVTWRSETECGPEEIERKVGMRLNPPGLLGNGIYRVPQSKLMLLQTTDKFLWFGKTLFPAASTQELTLTARNGSITVERAIISDPMHFSISNWGGTPPPFRLNDGESRKITVQFAPTDTTGYAGELQFVGTPCSSRPILLAGGDRLPQENSPLSLRSPVGGEIFGTCDSVAITWGGIPPDEPVRIQYSSDDGRNWHTISDSATGYEYRWLPPGPGTAYRIKVSTDAAQQHIISTIAGGGDLDEDEIFATQSILRSTMGVDVRDDTIFIAEAGRNKIRGVDLVSGVITTIAGTGLNGNGGDGGPATSGRLSSPTDVLVTDDTIFIADSYNHKIRVVDRRTGRIYTYAGTGAIGFSPDGTKMNSDTAFMNFPVSLEIDDRYLYVGESGTNRIRRIDRKTLIISTVAGGGTSYDSDGAPATVAQLSAPYGMTIVDNQLIFAERDAGRIRRVDLRTGIISTIAGNGKSGNKGDGDLAIRAELQLPTDVAFYGDSLFIADAANNRIRLVDMKSGIISTFAGNGIANYGGDDDVPWRASLNSPSGLAVRGDLLYVSDRLNDRIRAITLYRPDGLDSSRSPFSVIAPELKVNPLISGRRVDLGEVAVGNLADSIITALICNEGDGPLLIDSASIIGPHRDEFSVVGGLAPDPLLPGECRTVTIEFRPKGTGTREGAVIFHGACAGTDTVALTGTGRNGCDVVAVEQLDFGDIPFGLSARDSLLQFSLCNNSGEALQGIVSLSSPDGTYTLVEGAGPYELSAGECLDLTVRLTPQGTGLSMGMIDYGIPVGCGDPQTILSGRVLTPPELDVAPVDLGAAPCPDEAVDTLIGITNRGGTPLEITGINFTLNDEGFSLVSTPPTSSAPWIVPPGGTKDLHVRMNGTSAGPKTAELEIVSNDPAGPIRLSITGRRDSLRLAAVSPLLSIRRDAGASYPRDTFLLVENTGDRMMRLTGGTLNGSDPAFFAVPAGQFPIDVPPGETAQIPVQSLQPVEDRPYRAEIELSFEPTCSLPELRIDIIHAGTAPLPTALPLDFPALFCSAPEFSDSSITVRNDGGSTLRIDAISVVNDPENNFSHSASTPMVIEPGSSGTIPIRFNPQSTGIKSALLRLQTNTETGIEEIPLSGEKGEISFMLSATSLNFDPAARAPNVARVMLTNTGTGPITWSVPSGIGPFTVLSIIPAVTPVGGTSELTIGYNGPAGGGPTERLQIGEETCGITQDLLLRADDVRGVLRVRLPHDSALFNVPVSLPLRYDLQSGAVPVDQDTFTTTIRFIGTTFFFEGVTHGEIVEKVWNPERSELAVTIRGRFGDRSGDTLTGLIGRGLISGAIETPLAIDEFFWSRPSIETAREEGSFKVLGTCRDVGLHLLTRVPELERVSPNPASNNVTAEFSLSDWAWLRADLITPTGETIVILPPGNVPEGRHRLDIDASGLPPGLYLLRIETPHGKAEQGIIVVR